MIFSLAVLCTYFCILALDCYLDVFFVNTWHFCYEFQGVTAFVNDFIDKRLPYVGGRQAMDLCSMLSYMRACLVSYGNTITIEVRLRECMFWLFKVVIHVKKSV